MVPGNQEGRAFRGGHVVDSQLKKKKKWLKHGWPSLLSDFLYSGVRKSIAMIMKLE